MVIHYLPQGSLQTSPGSFSFLAFVRHSLGPHSAFLTLIICLVQFSATYSHSALPKCPASKGCEKQWYSLEQGFSNVAPTSSTQECLGMCEEGKCMDATQASNSQDLGVGPRDLCFNKPCRGCQCTLRCANPVEGLLIQPCELRQNASALGPSVFSSVKWKETQSCLAGLLGGLNKLINKYSILGCYHSYWLEQPQCPIRRDYLVHLITLQVFTGSTRYLTSCTNQLSAQDHNFFYYSTDHMHAALFQ